MDDEDKKAVQEFNGAVGQVAAGDIHNHAASSYWDWDSTDLINEWENCRRKMRQAQLKIFLAPNMIIFFSIIIFLLAVFFTGKLQVASQQSILGFSVLAFVAVTMFPKANKKYGSLITLQRQRMELIELVLLDRGIDL